MSVITEANTALAIDGAISENKGDQLAIRYRDKRYSYNDLAALMNRAGNLLKRRDIGVGDQILVAVSASPSLVASVLGAMKIGAVPVVVLSNVSEQTIASLPSDRIKLLIVDAARTSGFGNVQFKHLVVGDAGPGQPSFLQEMRASSSSLGLISDTAEGPAFGTVGTDGITWFSHAQIANEDPKLEKFDIGQILGHLARGGEVTIS
jgi:non-ribosomal peptide synthetase component E (peptide arylation enzyme)